MLEVIFLILALIGYSFLVCAFGVWLICIAFGLTFTWLKAFAVWFFLNSISGLIHVILRQE